MITKNVFVTLIGRPNVGKSSLLNRLLGEKIAIVSDKPQTTRNRITGVLTRDETQYVFIDTPGMHRPRTKLGQFMVRQVGESVADVDVAVLVTECEGKPTEVERQMLESAQQTGSPVILAVNKIDLLERKDMMLGKISQMSALYPFAAIVPLSALTGDGVEALLGEIGAFCSEGPHFFDDDTLTDQPERAIVSEIVREKLLKKLRDEVPHGTAVIIEKMHEREDGKMVDIDAVIVCERESHKGMIIGKKGAMLKEIATEARLDCETFLGTRVNLQCWVKVREGWRDNDTQLKNFGYRDQ